MGVLAAHAYHYNFVYKPDRVKAYNKKFIDELSDQTTPYAGTSLTSIDVTVEWANKFLPGTFAADTAQTLKGQIDSVKAMPSDQASTAEAVYSAYEALQAVIDTARLEFGWTDKINDNIIEFMVEITKNDEIRDFIPGPVLNTQNSAIE